MCLVTFKLLYIVDKYFAINTSSCLLNYLYKKENVCRIDIFPHELYVSLNLVILYNK